MMPTQKHFINIAADHTSVVMQPAVSLNADPLFEPHQWADTCVRLGTLLAQYRRHMYQRRLPRRKRRLAYDGVVDCCGDTHHIVYDVLNNVHKTACTLPKDTRRALLYLPARVCTDAFKASGPYNQIRFMRLQYKPLPIHAAWEAVAMLCGAAWALHSAVVRTFGGRVDAYDYFKLITFLQPLRAMNLSLQDLETALHETKAIARWELTAPGAYVEDATPLFKPFVRHLRYAVKRVQRMYAHYKAEGLVCSLLEFAPCDVCVG